VIETDTGDRVAELVRTEHPVLVILDLMLPGLSGLEVCRAMRQDPATADLPIVVLTARAAESDRILGLEAGADDYVTKPFSPRETGCPCAGGLASGQAREPVQRPHEVYEKGRLRVDFDAYEVRVDGRQSTSACASSNCCGSSCAPRTAPSTACRFSISSGDPTRTWNRGPSNVHIRRLRKHIERDDANPNSSAPSVRRVSVRRSWLEA